MTPLRMATWTKPDGQTDTCRILNLFDIATQAQSWNDQARESGAQMKYVVDSDAVFWAESGTGRNVGVFPRDISTFSSSLVSRVKCYFGPNASIRQAQPEMPVCSDNPSCGGQTVGTVHACVNTGVFLDYTGLPLQDDEDTPLYQTVVAGPPRNFVYRMGEPELCTHLEVVRAPYPWSPVSVSLQ